MTTTLFILILARMKNTGIDAKIIAELNFSNCPIADIPEWDPASDKPVPDCLKKMGNPFVAGSLQAQLRIDRNRGRRAECA